MHRPVKLPATVTDTAACIRGAPCITFNGGGSAATRKINRHEDTGKPNRACLARLYRGENKKAVA